ncbi:MAG: hypothetical protein NC181_03340 [Clostridium sp.]|nr:hypothetical protein [Clostridium sp.]MCM1444325.1 hypothetical protein [Candidatus Amulumruptor caecigallinarius]
MFNERNQYASITLLQEKDYNFFENLILELIERYKNAPQFDKWYAAIGDNCDGKTDENFISIGMVQEKNKISFSRIRIPKNETGKRVMEKFIRSYLSSGIKSQDIISNNGDNLNTIGYITTNDGKYLEVYTNNDFLIIDNRSSNLNYLN